MPRALATSQSAATSIAATAESSSIFTPLSALAAVPTTALATALAAATLAAAALTAALTLNLIPLGLT